MVISPHARRLLDGLANDHGLTGLDFDADGLIPITLDRGTQVALAYSEELDRIFILGIVDPDGFVRGGSPAWAFRENRARASRRTRLALDPASGALVLICDVFAVGTEYWQFSRILDAFVRDLGAVTETFQVQSRAAAPQAAEEPFPDHRMIRV